MTLNCHNVQEDFGTLSFLIVGHDLRSNYLQTKISLAYLSWALIF